MKPDTCLVIGASGLIGNTLWRALPADSRIGTYHHNELPSLIFLDLCDKHALTTLIHSISPKVIFHAAALANVDWCEQNPISCWETNVSGTQNIIDAMKNISAKLVYFSTDYIFDGTAGPYSEDDPPNPINVYGRTKLEAEHLIQDQLLDYLILRVTVIYGWEKQGKNFVVNLIKQLSQGNPVKVPKDQVGNPTYANNMVDVVMELVKNHEKGVFNVVGPERIDRHRLACKVADIFGLNPELLISTTTAELGQIATRPLNAGLKTDKVLSTISIRLMGTHEGLNLMKQNVLTFNQ